MKRSTARTTRRVVLGSVSGLVIGACTSRCARAPKDTDTGAGSSGSGGGSSGGGAGGSTGAQGGAQGGAGPVDCTATADNIQGPYYRPDAPFRTDLIEPNMPGTRLSLEGRVLSPACEPIAGALLDFWQADDAGGYDNDGVEDPPPDQYVLRGRQETDAQGRYALRTIIPGHYLNGDQYRPAHIHVTVSAPGYESLTTQLYFEGDPYNDVDPFIIESLIMALQDGDGEKEATFDFVLSPA